MQSPSNSANESAILRGWKEIAAHLGVTARTAQSWEKDRGLPVQRVPGKRGMVYCLVTELDAWLASGGRPAVEDSAPRSRHRVLILTAATVFAAAAAIGWRTGEPDQPAATLLEAAPLTSARDYEGRADLSPDASRVAFLVRGNEPTASVHVLDRTNQTSQVLAADALEESAVRWSPAGDTVAYVRGSARGLEIVEAGAEDFSPRVLVSLPGEDRTMNLSDNAVFDWGSRGLAVSAREGRGGPYFIALASPSGGSWTRVTQPPANYAGDTMPAFSRDGREIAFARFSSLSEAQLYAVDLETGVERRLLDRSIRPWGLDWLPDGSVLYAAREEVGPPRLRRLMPGAEASMPVTGAEYVAHFPSVSITREGATVLVYQRKERWNSIRHAAIGSETDPTAVVDSTWIEAWPDLSPDGRQLAFISTRTGATEVWIAPAGERGEATRLTQQNGPYTDMPRWSPDGTRISFTSTDGTENRDVYVVDVATRNVSRFTREESEEGRASWSRHGRFLYFRSDRSGTHQIWKQPVDGSGPATQVTTQGGYEAFESSDGATLYYIRAREQDELWAVPVSGGDERLILSGPRESRWRPVSAGIVFQQETRFLLRDAVRGSAAHLFQIPSGQAPPYGFAVSPALDALWWTQTDRNTSDLWIAEL